MKQRVHTLVTHAAELLTARTPSGTAARGDELERLELIVDGALAVDDGRLVAVGTTDELVRTFDAEVNVDASDRLVSPSFVEPHTHLVFGGTRHEEWEGKVLEANRPTIDAGIRSTIRATRDASDAELTARAVRHLDDMLRHGITTVEAKTGYGLSREQELRLLEITRTLPHPIDVHATYLGAHTVGPEHLDDRAGYVQEVIDTLPDVVGRAAFCDIAVDPVSFTAEEGRRMADVARRLGLALRFHADQTGDADGTALAVEFDAVSVDHLDHVSDAGLRALADSATVGVVFPGANFHLLDMTPSRLHPDRGARDLPRWAERLVASGAALALSTDFNPGTAPSTSMPMAMQLAARLYRWSFARVWHMATINAAAAMRLEHDRGSLAAGKSADFVVWDAASHGEIVHRFGSNLVRDVYRGGQLLVAGGSVLARS
jgi:imidazolonepropionase